MGNERLSLEALRIDQLKKAAGQVIYDRGAAYYDWGRVRIVEVSSEYALCYVKGTYPYQVEFSVEDNYLFMRCDCDYAAKGTICKHEVAAGIAICEHLEKMRPKRWSDRLAPLVNASKAAQQTSRPTPYLLFFSLQVAASASQSPWRIAPYQLPFSAISKDLQSLARRDPEALYQALMEMPEPSRLLKTPYTSVNSNGCLNCGREGAVLANVILERTRAYNYYFSPFPIEDYLSLISSMGSPLFFGGIENPLEKRLQILAEPGELRLEVRRGEKDLHLKARLTSPSLDRPLDLADYPDQVFPITEDPFWILVGSTLAALQNVENPDVIYDWLEQPELSIPIENEDEFLDKYYLLLARQFPLEGEAVEWETVEAQPVKRLYLNDAKGKLQARLRFGYGDYEVPYDPHPAETAVRHRPGSWALARVQRQVEAEQEAFRSLSSHTYRLKRAPASLPPGTFVLRANARPVDFLLNAIPRLTEDGYEIYGEEQLKTAHVNRNSPTISLTVSSGIDWFDVQAVVNFGELEVSLKEIRKAVRKRERYIKLADGSIGQIPEEWIERYQHLFALGKETGEQVRFANHHMAFIDEMLEGAEGAKIDAEFERRRRRLRSFAGIHSQQLPAGFTGELRPYQKAGYDWLHFLREFGFGGCLADDMGLGKTVQVLVFLLSLKEEKKNGASGSRPASLVVVPRSLLINWQREAERFTPSLRILEYFDKDRPQDLAAFTGYDLVITTYGIMLRDVKFLRQYKFDTILLDESQAIKNPLAQTSKAARLLQANHRLVLTGTPVENSTFELWSQFAFLNPGLLGSLDYYKHAFSSPIEKKGDENAAKMLRKMIYPFILRRTKDQVAPELPPRSERVLYCDMEPAQRKAYLRMRDYYRGVVLGILEEEGINKSRMKILEGLLRLRQIANHPILVDRKFRGDSGKFGLLLETLETLQSEGHKVLVFSQFVQMLKLVREALDQRKLPYAYLDGHTRDRQGEVDRFQDETGLPFFLISLKAGGTGLNLTAADYVIHIDPWWNPAVEMQATDRTHRIGQDKPVFVYKMISRDTVEEKILQLQAHKRDLVSQLITTESSFFKSLTPEDVRSLFG